MNLTALSKTISYALRHEPWVFELELDDEGWVPVDMLIAAIIDSRPNWRHLTVNHIRDLMEAADKQRFELEDGKIRALYGHSVPKKLVRSPADPPAILYHGTAPGTADIVLREGLKPMARQYVHLSADTETAQKVGLRKARDPVILRVRAAHAAANGVPFYAGNDMVWLADEVPGQFIERLPG